MKNLKLVFAVFAAVMILGSAVGVCAANGDVVGSIYSTDILAYVNDRPIPSYCLDGKTAVLVEDLEVGDMLDGTHYGFIWWYNDDTRTLTVNSNGTSGYGEMLDIKRGSVGRIVDNIYESDIKVIFNGIEVPSYSINGKTAVCIEDLGTVADDSPNADYGYSQCMCNFTWDNDNREVRLYTYQSDDFNDVPLHKMTYYFKDNILSVSYDQLGYYYNSVECDFTDEFMADINHIKPIIMDGETVGNMYFTNNGKFDYNIDTEKIYNMAKDLVDVLSYDEAVKFIAENYEIVDSRDVDGATVYLVKDEGGTRYLFYALKQGDLVLQSKQGYDPYYKTVEFAEEDGNLYLIVYPISDSHGHPATSRMQISVDEYIK